MTSRGPLDPDPDERMAALGALRAQGGMVPPPAAGAPWFAVSYAAVAGGLGQIEDFGGSAGSQGLPEEDKSIAGILEPRHGQIRRIINTVVAFHKSQKIEPYLVELTERLAAELAAAPGVSTIGVDVMPIFVDPIPPSAMARLLGFPADDALQYYSWAEELGAAFAAAAAEGRAISMAQGAPRMAQYVEERIAERTALPADDWPQDALSRFLLTEIDGVRLTPRAIVIQIMFMIGAGSETTRNLLGNLLYRLALDPALYAQLRDDRTLVEPTIEETLRIDAPAQFLLRSCLRDTELDGAEVQAGDSVMLSIASGNWDEAVFEDPEQFCPARASVRHLSFGTGPHICPGAPLARLETRTALNTFLDRFSSLSLAEGYEFDHLDHAMLHGPKSLRLVLHPA